jgi:hypothetical protein
MPRKRRETRIDPPERVTVTLGDMAFEGGCVAHDGDRTIFVDYGLPGERSSPNSTASGRLLRARR